MSIGVFHTGKKCYYFPQEQDFRQALKYSYTSIVIIVPVMGIIEAQKYFPDYNL